MKKNLQNKIKNIILFLIFLVFAFALPRPSLALDVLVAQEKNYPPFIYQDEFGQPQGISVDYLNLLADKTQHAFSFSAPMSLGEIMPKMRAGELDLVTSLTRTPDRELFLEFSKPYISVPAVLVLSKDSTVADFEDTEGLKVAVGRGYGVVSFLENNYPNLTLIENDDDETGLFSLALGQVDVAIMDVASATYLIREHAVTTVKIGPDVGFAYNLSFAVPKGNSNLIENIDSGLSLLTDQDKAALNKKWFGIDLTTQKPLGLWQNRTFKVVVLVTSFAFLLVLVWVWSLRKIVRKKTLQLESVNRELDARVSARTKDLEASRVALEKNIKQLESSEKKVKKQLEELEILNTAMLGREAKMAELKKENEFLKKQGGQNVTS